MVEIKKEFRIQEIRVSNASFQIILEGKPCGQDEELALTLDLDAATRTRYKIPNSLKLVGRTLVCTFQSRELPLQQEDGEDSVDFEAVENDDLEIESLKKEEVVRPTFDSIPPDKFSEVSCTLTLSSFSKEDGIHPAITLCPFYHFVLKLTDEEYEACCKGLAAHSVFKVNFQLK